jgi:hypothetical protein
MLNSSPGRVLSLDPSKSEQLRLVTSDPTKEQPLAQMLEATGCGSESTSLPSNAGQVDDSSMWQGKTEATARRPGVFYGQVAAASTAALLHGMSKP